MLKRGKDASRPAQIQWRVRREERECALEPFPKQCGVRALDPYADAILRGVANDTPTLEYAHGHPDKPEEEVPEHARHLADETVRSAGGR